MISPALMLSWIWGRKRKPMPEYKSLNTWTKWMEANNKVLELQDKLIRTFNSKQMKIYEDIREKALEADREKLWQTDSLLERKI